MYIHEAVEEIKRQKKNICHNPNAVVVNHDTWRKMVEEWRENNPVLKLGKPTILYGLKVITDTDMDYNDIKVFHYHDLTDNLQEGRGE